MRITSLLATPPVPRLTPEGVFDAFGWCTSDTLEWSRPSGRAFDATTPLDGSDPARMVFVFRRPVDFLPRELAKLHAFGLGLEEEWALAPYAIDDATDELFTYNVRPRDVLWLAADNLNALFWGLHDWSHFHNHGPFEERAWTELQCDGAALSWIWLNRAAIGIDDVAFGTIHASVQRGIVARFEAEGKPLSPALLAALSPEAIADWSLRIGVREMH
ncbi:hypothetical protein [Pendulispora albinea]|uniref:Uncharacterized protein n=1 Tax=Pendulispora albinea TaxID=2741071 RepID=A0ABZ2M9H7_9BACT